jgi:hypothetical protein
MARVANPYRPGFNERPGELAGRDEVLDALLDAVEIAALDGRMPRPTLLVGSRGVGKTVLLGEVAAIAGARFGWPRVHLEMRPETPFTTDLVDALRRARELVDALPRHRRLRADSATLRAGLAGVGGEVHFTRDDHDPEGDAALALRRALAELVSAVIDRESGFVLTVDEMQLADRKELTALTALLQEGTGECWPVVGVFAGLPLMREPDHSVTYFERGAWYELDALSKAEAVQALKVPAEQAGRLMDADAADLLADATGGYPYAVQLYGHHSWRTSTGRATIDLAAAREAVPRAARELERGLYAGRWTAASPMQREYLGAIAALGATGTQTTSRAVADRLGRTTKQLSTTRDDLLKQGTLTAQGDELRFTIPGMSEYVLRMARQRPATAAIQSGTRATGPPIDRQER